MKTLESFISTAEYVIANYLKDHADCNKKELMPHVLERINMRENKEGDTIHETKQIHILSFILAVKEMEKEGVIQVKRGNVPFPMLDNKSRFSLKQ